MNYTSTVLIGLRQGAKTRELEDPVPEQLPTNSRLFGASLTAPFRLSGVISHVRYHIICLYCIATAVSSGFTVYAFRRKEGTHINTDIRRARWFHKPHLIFSLPSLFWKIQVVSSDICMSVYFSRPLMFKCPNQSLWDLLCIPWLLSPSHRHSS